MYYVLLMYMSAHIKVPWHLVLVEPNLALLGSEAPLHNTKKNLLRRSTSHFSTPIQQTYGKR